MEVGRGENADILFHVRSGNEVDKNAQSKKDVPA